ncbi:hypothetical protein GQ44DRAFT_681563 [Phaeosphaeriaceae sp. PMI808]|nr:hypothetical protein GQ44DRAFT_681563 [Phaeosphaeriaceae sp. PMI808]
MPRPPSSPSPPPASFPYTAGHFDYPHASASPSSSSRSAADGPFTRLLQRFADGEPPLTLHYAPAAPPPMPRRPPRSSRRSQMHRLFGPPRDSEPVDNLLRRPSTANPNRPRATPSERYLRRSSARIREARAELESASDLLDSVSDIPIANPFVISNTNIRARSPTVEVNADRRQSKRRKIEHNDSPNLRHDGFRYGHKGQVVPGRLKMEVLSCDGGEYYDKDLPIGLHNVRNVLKNDNSVYCSENSRCNLLLKHIGDAPFALEKIVIRAPDRGFTAPVQEGLIFVSMSADDLLSSTAGYDLRYSTYSPAMSPSPSFPIDEEPLSLREAIEDPIILQHSHQNEEDDLEERADNHRRRRMMESYVQTRIHRVQNQLQPTHNDDESYNENCEHITDESYMGIVRVSAPTPPPFTVTAASEEDESESDEDLPSAAIIADRLRRENRWRAESNDSDDLGLPRFGGLRRAAALDYNSNNVWRGSRDRHIAPIRATRIGAPSQILSSDHQLGTEKLTPPNARFFIAKNKSKITIKFYPAISGRNVLLKLWSPTHDGNIDIESVQFFGFSGPRFFPAIQPC